MSFYNPYMSKPDYGQGFNDFISQLFQMMMYRKYMDSMGGDEKQQPDIVGGVPRTPAIGQAQGHVWRPEGYKPPVFGLPEQTQDNPQMMQMLSKLFQQAMMQRGNQQSPWARYQGPITY